MSSLLLSLWLASTTLSPSCARRADVEAIRTATPDERQQLREQLDADLAKARGHDRGCVAAVAAEAAFVDGDRAATRALLAVVADALPQLRRDIAPHRALLAAEAGDAAAVDVLGVDVDVRAVAWRQRIALALARAQHNDAEVKTLLRRAASRDPSALRALCAAGEAARCVDLVVRFPGSDDARAVEDSVDVDALTAEAIAQRLEGLLGAARPKRAVRDGERWLVAHPTEPARGKALAAVAQGLLRLGKNTEAVERTRGYVRHDDSGAVAGYDVDVARVHAKALGRAGDHRGESEVWRMLATAAALSTASTSTPAPPLAAEARFFQAFSLVEGDAIDDAIAAFDLAAPVVVDTPWHVQVEWQRGFLRLTAKGDAAGALPFLDAAVAKNDREVRKHRYWRARALDVVDAARAKRERQQLITEDPLDWYGQLARRDLGLPTIAGADVDVDAVVRVADGLKDADAERVRLLYALGFDDEAKAACRARALGADASPPTANGDAESTKQPEKKPEKKATLAEIGLCQAVDDAHFGWRRGALFLPNPPLRKHKLNPAPSWRVSYAMPYLSSVEKAAAAAGVPASFVYAIMRTESGFDARAVSVAGARGALQLLPSVSRKVGSMVAHSGAGDVDDDIALGAGLLGILAREHGSLLLAAAAYNGAPEHAQSWVARFGSHPVDVFVERIPFKETRDYVKRVLAVEAVYRGLRGQPAALALPTTALSPATTVTLFPYDE